MTYIFVEQEFGYKILESPVKEISTIQKKVEDWFAKCKSSGPMHSEGEVDDALLEGLDRRHYVFYEPR